MSATDLAPPDSALAEQKRSNERFRRAALTTAASAAAKAIAIGTSLISIPLTLNYLGAERYGLWATISSVNVLVDYADLGLGNGLLNAIAAACARDQKDKLRTDISSAFFLLVAIAATLLAAFFILSPLVPWPSSLVMDARNASAVFACCFALNLPLGIVRRVQLGFQEGFTSNLWQCGGSLLSLAALLIAMHMHAGLPTLVLCLTGAPVVSLGLNWLVEFTHVRPELRPSLRWFRWHAGWDLIHAGLLFLILQAAWLTLFTLDPMIVAHYLGLAAVADFSVTQRLFLMALTLQAMWLSPLWPAYGEAAARGDIRWIRNTLLRSTAVATGISVLIGLVLVVFRGPILAAWLHRSWGASFSLCLGLALCAVALTAGNSTSMFLNGVNAIREQAGAAVVMAIVVTVLKIQLCFHFGAAGLPWGTLIGYSAIMTPFLFVLIRRMLHRLDYA